MRRDQDAVRAPNVRTAVCLLLRACVSVPFRVLHARPPCPCRAICLNSAMLSSTALAATAAAVQHSSSTTMRVVIPPRLPLGTPTATALMVTAAATAGRFTSIAHDGRRLAIRSLCPFGPVETTRTVLCRCSLPVSWRNILTTRTVSVRLRQPARRPGQQQPSSEALALPKVLSTKQAYLAPHTPLSYLGAQPRRAWSDTRCIPLQSTLLFTSGRRVAWS
ncbi:hypothetical protein IWX90DRAFT_319461 [Phyllosticta citrichinensis]|uniref:Secreted protein n=1 Tax=Phyllosticta citrichinensis TaxID=1130410 RepID=A0ABR1XJR6_9PEZI